MIAYCRTCKQQTIVRERAGARCSWCDEIIVRGCAECDAPLYQYKRRGRPNTYCASCAHTRKERKHAHV